MRGARGEGVSGLRWSEGWAGRERGERAAPVRGGTIRGTGGEAQPTGYETDQVRDQVATVVAGRFGPIVACLLADGPRNMGMGSRLGAVIVKGPGHPVAEGGEEEPEDDETSRHPTVRQGVSQGGTPKCCVGEK